MYSNKFILQLDNNIIRLESAKNNGILIGAREWSIQNPKRTTTIKDRQSYLGYRNRYIKRNKIYKGNRTLLRLEIDGGISSLI